MTVTNEYGPIGDAEQQETGASGGLFGLQLTPPIIGAGLAVLGIGLAAYVGTQLVMPISEENAKLSTEIDAKQSEVQKQTAELNREAEANAKLADAQRRRAFVTSMFASEKSLETLLFDVNQVVDKINAGIPTDEQKAKLTKFEPVILQKGPAAPKPGVPVIDADIVNDTSLGSALAGQLRRKVFKVEFEGNYRQTRTFLQNLERMQSLLVVRNLKTQLVEQAPKLEIEFRQGKIVPVAAVQPQLKTSFDLHALLPLKQEEKPAVAATPSPTK